MSDESLEQVRIETVEGVLDLMQMARKGQHGTAPLTAAEIVRRIEARAKVRPTGPVAS